MFFILVTSQAMSAQEQKFNIWTDTSVSEKVSLTPYIAEGEGNPAVIVCPGGSYFWLDRKTEGRGVAQWLQSQGISAFVLEYRVGGIDGFIYHYRLLTRGHRFPDPLEDVQRSIQLIRENYRQYGIDPHKVGVMGFSAGGHLAGLAGKLSDKDYLAQLGIESKVSLRPDFVAMIYPVVSMSAPCTHKRSRRGLLGDNRQKDSELRNLLSLENNLPADMPPVFLMNCVDDPTVKYHNSELLDSALTAKQLPHKYIQYQTGGHGFGANPKKTSREAIQWKNEFINWLKSILQ